MAASREHYKTEIKDMSAKLGSVCGQDKGHDRGAQEKLKGLQSEKQKVDQTLRKMTEACERIKGQLDSSNKRLAELERDGL